MTKNPLQINNWNEYQKERKSEKLLLSKIQDNLKYDLNDLIVILQRYKINQYRVK